MIQKKKEKYCHLFFLNEKVNLQEKINTLDGKIQYVQKYLKNFMDYKNNLLIEMNDLIVNHSKNNLKNPSRPAQASTESFTQTSTYVVNQVSTQKSIQASSSTTNYTLNVITPPSTKSKKMHWFKCRRVSDHAIINKQYCLRYFSFLEIDNK